jgi:hypothetical protein
VPAVGLLVVVAVAMALLSHSGSRHQARKSIPATTDLPQAVDVEQLPLDQVRTRITSSCLTHMIPSACTTCKRGRFVVSPPC